MTVREMDQAVATEDVDVMNQPPERPPHPHHTPENQYVTYSGPNAIGRENESGAEIEVVQDVAKLISENIHSLRTMFSGLWNFLHHQQTLGKVLSAHFPL